MPASFPRSCPLEAALVLLWKPPLPTLGSCSLGALPHHPIPSPSHGMGTCPKTGHQGYSSFCHQCSEDRYMCSGRTDIFSDLKSLEVSIKLELPAFTTWKDLTCTGSQQRGEESQDGENQVPRWKDPMIRVPGASHSWQYLDVYQCIPLFCWASRFLPRSVAPYGR